VPELRRDERVQLMAQMARKILQRLRVMAEESRPTGQGRLRATLRNFGDTWFVL
jgi:hypothetical protein